MRKTAQKGFTLIELLIVIAIIAALAVTVYVALNPTKRLQDSHNARRSADVDTILSAIHTYIIDNKGTTPTGLSATEQQLGSAATGCAISTGGCNVTATACLDLSSTLAAYLKNIPVDPSLPAGSNVTNYSVSMDSNGIVTVKACGAEGGTLISASR